MFEKKFEDRNRESIAIQNSLIKIGSALHQTSQEVFLADLRDSGLI
jgi:hypothetical protein